MFIRADRAYRHSSAPNVVTRQTGVGKPSTATTGPEETHSQQKTARVINILQERF